MWCIVLWNQQLFLWRSNYSDLWFKTQSEERLVSGLHVAYRTVWSGLYETHKYKNKQHKNTKKDSHLGCRSRQMVFFLHRKITSIFLPLSNLQHHIRVPSSQVGVYPDTRSWMSSYSRQTSNSEDLCTNRSMPIREMLSCCVSSLCQCRSSQWPDLWSVLCSGSEPQSNSLLYSLPQTQNPLMFLQLSLRTKEGLLRSHNGSQNHILYIMFYSKDQ